MSQKIFEVKELQTRSAQVERTLRAMPGVENVELSPRAGTVTIEYDSMRTDPIRMKEALRRLGIEAHDWPPHSEDA